MYYIITDSGVLTARNMKEMNNKNHILAEAAEYHPLGPDMVCIVTQQDLDFLQDKARVSNIMFGNFFRKDNSVKIFLLINLILTALILFTK